MNPETNPNNKIPEGKIYKDRAIGVGTFLGGPIAAGYFIAENFKEFGESHKAKLTWIIAIALTLLLTVGLYFAPFADRIPSQLFPLVYSGLIYALVRFYQGGQIDAHLAKGGQLYSWWRVIGISMIGLVLTLAFIFALVFITMPSEKTKTYGKTKNEITFPESNISESEVDSLAQALQKTGFFDDKMKSYVYVKRSGKTYEISVGMDNTASINSEVIKSYDLLRRDLQKFFPENKIVFHLAVDDIDNVIKRIE